jgi:NADH-quinone oxidoreductase subunit J
MMTKTERILDDHPSIMRRSVAAGIAAAFFGAQIYFTMASFGQSVNLPQTPMTSDVAGFGRAFLDAGPSGYVLPFELISVLLLAVLIGGVVIARKDEKSPKGVKP